MSEAIIKVSRLNEKEYKRLSKATLTRSLKKFTTDKMIHSYGNLYEMYL